MNYIPSDRSKIVLLGTGNPNADPARSGPALAVLVDGTPYLVDCGPGIVRRAAAAFHNGINGLDVIRLNNLFITHLHSDHTAGLPDLILTPWVLGRRKALHVYGPRGVNTLCEHLLLAYHEDIQQRIKGLEPANTTGWVVESHEVIPGRVYQDEQVRVEAYPVSHGTWAAFSYKFTTPDSTIAISGDRLPTADAVSFFTGCDILIHEVYSSTAFERLPPDWQRYHSSVHTSSIELARLAGQVKPELLVLTHQLLWGVSEEELLGEIKDLYPGEVISGRDLDVF
ncbi:MAG: MBL fold metallo-hydrolase [Anaerolineales bacterium]|jgi:ribonuclease BN (tRNA processing enzyme)